jgi:hypothetical protein
MVINKAFKIVGGAVLLGLVAWYFIKMRKGTEIPITRAKLPDNLKSVYDALVQGGYQTTLSPVSHPSAFIKVVLPAESGNVNTLINADESFVIVYDPNKPPFVAKFVNGDVLYKGNVIAEDTDLVNAILTIVENEQYKL